MTRLSQMSWRAWPPGLAVALGYVLVALVFAWPLPLYLGSRLTGDPGGDTGVYVWNQWVFHYETAAGRNPLSTQQIFSLSPRVDLSQHNYTAFLNLLSLPLIANLGVVSAFNVVLLAISVLTALCAYRLARLAFPTTRLEAFIAGLAFAWSPILVARATGHFSLVAAAPLAAFVYCVIQADRSRSTVYCAMAGLCMAWAAFCDPYFAVFCLMIAGMYVLSQLVTVTRRERLASVRWLWLLNVLILTVAVLVGALLFGRGARLDVWGLPISVRGLYTPVLVLTLLVSARIASLFRTTVKDISQSGWGWRFALVAGVACAVPLSPVLYGLGQNIMDGRFVNPPILWRSSPRGADLLAFLEPNPNHPVARWLFGDAQGAAPVAFVEYTAALSIVALTVVAVALWRASFRPWFGWWWLTLGFLSLALGPFVIVAGTNTMIPTPWALLRYVPLVSAVRTPTRFAIVVALGVAMLLAGAVAAIGERWPHRRRTIGWTVLLLVACELFPAPRTLYSGEYSPLSHIIAADPGAVRVLNLPFGVRDGVSSAGNFSARAQFEQTRHHKPLIGGYLSRVSSRRLSTMTEEHPLIASLIRLSEGHELSAAEARQFVEGGPAFVERTNIGYVLIDTRHITPRAAALAVEAFRLEAIAVDGSVTLYRTGPEIIVDAR